MTDPEHIVRVADDRFAIAVADTASGQALARRLRRLPGCLEAVGGIAVVECQFDPTRVPANVFLPSVAAECTRAAGTAVDAGTTHEIPVVYGGDEGPDLAKVCTALGIDRDEFVRRHTASVFRVAMLGFTPGFAYLDGTATSLAVPRRETPRRFVPAGSIGIAGERTGIYALDGPGGWQIVGRTAVTLFDADAAEPFRLEAGDRVRFVKADA